MVGGKKLFVILLLAILGLNILGDVFSRVTLDPVKNEHISSNFSTEKDVFSSEDSSFPAVPYDCDDVAHLEHCHVGHCSHVFVTDLIDFKRGHILQNPVIQIAEHKSPFLEGLKRPPRILS